MTLGRKIRELRQAKDWSLAELAKKSGVALSSLSRIETGRMTGTLESHIRIARAMGARLAELYASLDAPGPVVEVKPTEEASDSIAAGKGALLSVLTSSPLQKKMLPALIHLAPKRSAQRQRGPAGSERFIYVLKGQLEVTIADQKVRANPGESVYLQAFLPHTLANAGGTPLSALSVICPPAL